MERKATSGIMVILLLIGMSRAVFYIHQSYESSGDMSTPEPYIANPLNGSLIYGNVTEVSAVEMNLALDIVSTTFEYAQAMGGPWILIVVDSNRTDGWRTFWNLTCLGEGDYYVRATMLNNVSQVGSDLSHVYLDPTPPAPKMTARTFPTIVSGQTNLTAATCDENVDSTEFSLFEESWTHCNWIDKPVKPLDQDNIDVEGSPTLPNWDGSTSCGPTAAASCLAYWDGYVGSSGQRPYKDLYDETEGDKDGDTYPDGLEKMARRIYEFADTNRFEKGTGSNDLRNGINAYIKEKGLANKLRARVMEASVGVAMQEFLRCQDVIALFTFPGNDETPGTNDDEEHFVTISSVHIQNLYIPLYGFIQTFTGQLDFMDPSTGTTDIGDYDARNPFQLKGDWNRNGSKGANEFATLKEIITVCPNSPSWVQIGIDYDETDGWQVLWDTTQLPDAYYLIRATMTDATGNTGTDIMLVYINNARITDITPMRTVVGQGCDVDIEVSVENLYVHSASFSITLHCNETVVAVANVSLASKNSTTLQFTWNTEGFAKGNYTIAAYVHLVLGETDTTDNNYTNGWVFVALVGDINADGIVDIEDIYSIALAYGSYGPNVEYPGSPAHPKYDPNLDINNDEIIDIEDIYIAALHYGETDP